MADVPANATQSPYTYEEMKRRQAALGPAGPSGPVEPDMSDIDEDVLEAPALEDSVAVPEVAPELPPAREETPSAPLPSAVRAKRLIVMRKLRDTPEGQAALVRQIRREIPDIPEDATPQEVLPAHFAATNEEIVAAGGEPITPEEYERGLWNAHGPKVDRALLSRARSEHPGAGDETDLVDRIYKQQIRDEDIPPLTYEDKAKIVARRFPTLHASALETEKALKVAYEGAKARNKNVGSYREWLHDMAAPTLFEKTMGVAASVPTMVGRQLQHVKTLSEIALSAPELAATVAGAAHGDVEAQEKLRQAGLGAVDIAALAAGPIAKAGLGALEPALGAAGPLFAGAAEGAAIGGVQAGGEAAVEGKPLGEVAHQAGVGALVGAPLGAAVGAVHGHVQRVGAARTAAEEAATREAELKAATTELPTASTAPAAAAAPATETEAFARHQDEMTWTRTKTAFATKHGLDPETADEIIRGERVYLSDYGVTPEELQQVREAMPGHLVPVEAPPEVAAAKAAGQPAPPPASAERPPVTERLKSALEAGEAAAKEQRKLYRLERSKRIGRAQAAEEAAGGGVAGHRAALAELEGEMPKVKFEVVRAAFGQEEVDDLFRQVVASDLSPYDKLTAKNGLQRLLGIDPEGPPRPVELQVMSRVFGQDFVKVLARERTLMERIGAELRDVLNIPRTIMTTGDFSLFGRTTATLIGTPEYWKAIIPTIRAWGSEKYAQSMLQYAEKHGALARDAGVHFSDLEHHVTEEATMASHLLDRLPGPVGKYFRANYRSFVAGINKIRVDNFNRIYQNAVQAGVDVSDKKWLNTLADLVNNSTGRGRLPKSLEGAAEALSQAFFAPRLVAARLQAFNPWFYLKLGRADVGLLKEAARQQMAAVSAGISILGLLSLAGWKVGANYLSADFGKARRGNTRIDVWAGHAQVARLFAQIAAAKTVSSTTGRMTDLRSGKFGSKTVLDLIGQFFQNKEAPIPSFLTLVAQKYSNQTGPDRRPINLGKEALDRVVPLPFGTLLEAAAEWHNEPATLGGLAVAGQIGWGVDTYGAGIASSLPLTFKNSGVTIHVPAKLQAQFYDEIQRADEHATAKALALITTKPVGTAEADKLTKDAVKSERQKVIYRWVRANEEVINAARGREGAKAELVYTPEQGAIRQAETRR